MNELTVVEDDFSDDDADEALEGILEVSYAPWARGKEHLIPWHDEATNGTAIISILHMPNGMLEVCLYNEPLSFNESMLQIAMLRMRDCTENWKLPSRQELAFVKDELSLDEISGCFWCSDILDYRERLTYRTIAIDIAIDKVVAWEHAPGPYQLLAVRAYT